MQTTGGAKTNPSQKMTIPNRPVELQNGTQLAYRRRGNASTGNPRLVFQLHFRGNLDETPNELLAALIAFLPANRNAVLASA
jgi:hypothetical protein